MKVYSNFDQIDHDLKILKLKRKIGAEEIKLNVKGAKGSLSFNMSPVSKVTSILGSIAQKAIAAKIANAIFGFKRVKDVDADNEYKAST